jgi:hypothetical protein
LGRSKGGKELGLARFGEEIGQLGQNEGRRREESGLAGPKKRKRGREKC